MKDMYFDYAAATPVHPRVFEAMQPYFMEKFGNPSSIHSYGVEARKAIESSRKEVAELLNAHADEIIFTSGATESINLAILGVARAHRKHGKHIVSSTAEHKATLEALKADGFEITLLDVDSSGMVSVKDVLAAIRHDTILVSVIFVNNEVGTINPVREIGHGVWKYRKVLGEMVPLFHVDITQAVPFLYVDVEKYHIDLASFSASKMYGPKGVGALYVRRGTVIEPFLVGGSQEHHVRPGTENVPGIVGFGTAAAIAQTKRDVAFRKVTEYRALFLDELKRRLPDIRVNGHAKQYSPHILNVNIPGIEAEELILRLDAQEVFVSAASACTNADMRSHVLKAMGYSAEDIRSNIRFSFGRGTTKGILLKAADIIVKTVLQLREKNVKLVRSEVAVR